jgi:pectate lyase
MYFKNFDNKTVIEINSISDFANVISNSIVNINSDLENIGKINIKDVNNVIINGNKHKITLHENETLKFKNNNNLKIQDLDFICVCEKPNRYGEISLNLSTCTNVDVESCNFLNCEDEQLSIKHFSTNIYVHNCRFEFTNCFHHSFAVLIGVTEDDYKVSTVFDKFENQQKSNVIFHQCYFNGGDGRYPRVRNAKIDLINCIWDKECHGYLVGLENSEAFVDSCYILHRIKRLKFFINKFGGYVKANIINVFVNGIDWFEKDGENIRKSRYEEELIKEDITPFFYDLEILSKDDLLSKFGIKQ